MKNSAFNNINEVINANATKTTDGKKWIQWANRNFKGTNRAKLINEVAHILTTSQPPTKQTPKDRAKAAKAVINCSNYITLDSDRISIKVGHINYDLTIEEQAPLKRIQEFFISLGYAGGLYSEYYTNTLLFEIGKDKGAALYSALPPYFKSSINYKIKGITQVSDFKAYPFAQGFILEKPNRNRSFTRSEEEQLIKYYKSI